MTEEVHKDSLERAKLVRSFTSAIFTSSLEREDTSEDESGRGYKTSRGGWACQGRCSRTAE